MAQAIFISEQWLKNNTVLPYNLDVKEYYSFLKIAQDTYIRDVLGDSLYDKLSTNLIAATLTPDQTKLLEMIRPSLAQYIIYKALPFLRDKIKNIGIVSTADDKQNRSDDKAFDRLRQEILDTAEYYMVRVQKYLCHNKALFPEYNYSNSDVNPNNTSGYTCDLYIDPLFVDEKFIKTYYNE
jgi:hypothetical protein